MQDFSDIIRCEIFYLSQAGLTMWDNAASVMDLVGEGEYEGRIKRRSQL